MQRVCCVFLVSPCWESRQVVNTCAYSAHWRFLYFHGQRHARLLKNQTVYDEPKLSSESSRLIRFLSPLLFRAPEVHLREMKELWTDEIIIEITWKKFMTKLQDEWIGFVLWVGFVPCCDYRWCSSAL
jgi:hypothetical protein